MRFPMILLTMIALTIALSPVASMAADGGSIFDAPLADASDTFNTKAKAKTEAVPDAKSERQAVADEPEEPIAAQSSPSDAAAVSAPTSRRPSVFDDPDLEAEVAALRNRTERLEDWRDRTIDWLNKRAAGEDERIEKVVRRVLGELNITTTTAGGETRNQVVQVGTDWRGKFTLGPQERITGYTNPLTGEFVTLSTPQYRATSSGAPVQVYDDPFMQMRTSGNQGGFQVRQGPMMRWLGRTGQAGTCRMVNGQMQCN